MNSHNLMREWRLSNKLALLLTAHCGRKQIGCAIIQAACTALFILTGIVCVLWFMYEWLKWWLLLAFNYYLYANFVHIIRYPIFVYECATSAFVYELKQINKLLLLVLFFSRFTLARQIFTPYILLKCPIHYKEKINKEMPLNINWTG